MGTASQRSRDDAAANRRELERLGHSVTVIAPPSFRTVPCPTYPEIRLALLPGRRLAAALDAFEPDAIHVATEGPLGIAARRHCVRNGLSFTASYHTQFPQYLRKRAPIPESWSYAFLRHHHRPRAPHARGDRASAPRPGRARLRERRDLVARRRRRAVSAVGRDALALPRPIWMYAGRVAVEKNLDAFLVARSSGHEGRGRRRARSRGARAPLSERACSRATASAPSSLRTSRRPTCSSSRAAPTRSGS